MAEVSTRYGRLHVPDSEHDIIGRFLARYGEWAWCETLFVASLVGDGVRVLDAGAFAGTFGLGLAQRRRLGFLCFVEANPAVVPLLEANALCCPCPCAVAGALLGPPGMVPRRGTSEPGNLGSASFAEEAAGEIAAPPRAVTLEALRHEHGAFDLIKLDVEGMELEVLQGDAAFLAQGGTTLWVECNEDPRSVAVARQLLEWRLPLFYFAFPSFNPANFNSAPNGTFPFAFEAALLAAPRVPPALDAELQACGCILRPVHSLDDLRQALWLTPRWGRPGWEQASTLPELAALAGRTLRGETFEAFLPPGGASGVPALLPWEKIAALGEALREARARANAAERELARVAARSLEQLAAAGALREQLQRLEQEHAAADSEHAKRGHARDAVLADCAERARAAEETVAIMRASTLWRVGAPGLAMASKIPALRSGARSARALLRAALGRA